MSGIDIEVPNNGERKFHQLTHYQQKHNWDCGLSCVLMVLPFRDRNCILNNLSKFLQEEGFGESTWTIDLSYILYRFKMDFLYTTITMGVDPGYVKENFYDKVLAKDSDRVNFRFSEAARLGIRIENRRVSSNEIVDHISYSGPVIVLTNANMLLCSRCSPSGTLSCYPSCFSKTSSYQGHYIVLVGCDKLGQQLLYRNPTVKDKVCQMSCSALEEARTSYGTDEDVIFVFEKS